MNKVYLFFIFVFVQHTFFSQSLANYSTVRNTGIAYTSINTTGNAFNSWRNTAAFTQDDNRSDFTDIGFDFWYDGVRYTKFSVSTNGYLDFSSSTADGGPTTGAYGYDNTAFTSFSNLTGTAIAPFYDDLTAQGGVNPLGTSIKYYLAGSAPSRTLTIEWINMAVYLNTTPSLNFQVELVETTGQILIHYGTMNTGTQLFSYSMGLNSPSYAGAVPNATELKELQTANANTFNNTLQNGLSAMPTANSQYIFTSPIPTPTAGTLTFSGVSQNSMTLNWTNWATNEVGYVLYLSTDGVNYSFYGQTASNAVTLGATGLLPLTTYYWKLFSVTEGCLSNPIYGTQNTSAGGNKVSIISGNWNTATTWSPTGVPVAGDNVTISNGHVVTINTAAQCNILNVGAGSAATLQFGTTTARSLIINNNLIINPNANFIVDPTASATHSVYFRGDVTNNGVINFATAAANLCNAFFIKTGNQNILGTGTVTKFNLMQLNLGNSANNVLDITSSNFSAPLNFLSLVNGTFKLSTPNTVNLVPFVSPVTLSQYTGLWLNAANAVVTLSTGITCSGKVTVSNGTLNIGSLVNQDFLSSGGTFSITGGVANIAGKYYSTGLNNLSYFSISGGTLTVPTISSTSTTDAPFQIAGAGSKFDMMGGVIVIPREGGLGIQNFGFINTGATLGSVTGGTLQIGNSTTPAGQTISINSSALIANVLVNSSNVIANVSTNPLLVVNNITIASGTLNSNATGITLGGNWNNVGGLFLPTTSTVNFNGTSSQSIFKTSGEIFNHLYFTGAGIKTLASPIKTIGNFSINTGSNFDVSVSNYSVLVNGNFINSGNYNARTGVTTFSGTVVQNIGGLSTTNFYDITLNNTAGATLTNAENLVGTLNLKNGAFNTNAKVFTMISDANGTARIAALAGTGDIVGNVTVQRFALGGTTGWTNIGTPISSALTFADWNDNIPISCPICPQGTAGGFTSIYGYNEVATGSYSNPAAYVAINNITDPISPLKGYWVYLGNGAVTTSNIVIDVTGTVNKNNIAINLMYTNTGSAADDGWNLITNPYPSAISWASLKGITTNIDNAIYVYNPDLNGGAGGSATYVSGISSPAVGSGGIGDVIPMGQGFQVHVTAATTLNAKEINKVAGNPTFLKTSAATSSASQPLMRLQLLGAPNYNDETVLYLEPSATDFFDSDFDAVKLAGQDPFAPSIALEKGNTVFQINAVAPITGNFIMPLKTLTGYSGSYTLSLQDFSSFPAGACINLYDKFTNTSTDLKANNYVFNLIDTTTVARFNLLITINPLIINSNITAPTCASPNTASITAIGASSGPWNYKWTNSGGALVKQSLNKLTKDSITNLISDTYQLEINTVGMCDNNISNFTILPIQLTNAQFNCVDSVNLNLSGQVTFTNTSINASYYNWDFGDGIGYSSLTNPVYNYNTMGTYSVQLVATSINGCNDTLTKTIVVTNATAVGINQIISTPTQLLLKKQIANIYELDCLSQNFAEYNVTLFDALGKKIKNFGPLQNQTLQINLNDYSQGIYYLNVTSPNFYKTYKLVKE